MAKKRSQEVEESRSQGVAEVATELLVQEVEEGCPTFTLHAGWPGHLRALIAAAPWLAEQLDWGVIRAFELWEDAHPCR